jgi:hypothetical protein
MGEREEWVAKNTPDEQTADVKASGYMCSHPRKIQSIFPLFKCLPGMHDWGRWAYVDWQERTEVKRECQWCHIQQKKISEGNDLV